MPKQPKKSKGGRPATLPGGVYVTVKFSAAQMKALRRMGGYIPGRMPAMIRDLLDVGIKAAKAARAR